MHEINTFRAEYLSQGMNHFEGGWPKDINPAENDQTIKSQSQIFRYDRGIFCLPHWPKFSDLFDLCLHWVFLVRADFP